MNSFWRKLKKDVVFHKDKLNIIESCIDRHAFFNPDKKALIFEDKTQKQILYTYKELYEQSNKFANLLNSMKVKKQSRVFLFLPKIPELYISFLGIIKQGSIVAPLFEAFKQEGLELRLKKGDANVLVTNKELFRRLKNKPKNMKIIIIDSKKYKRLINKQSHEFKTVLMNEKDTCILMFTSSTAGTPVAGIQIPHRSIIQQHFTAKFVLNLNQKERYWCTAHPGWITGAVYGILAPLSTGCTTYIYEEHFDVNKWLSFISRNKISIIYTAPSALRMIKPFVKRTHLKNIKYIFSVGEALTKSVFEFYSDLGVKIRDTYWQTETGAIVIANWSKLKNKAGCMGKAIPGIEVGIKNENIALKPSWPSMMTGIYKHKKMYKGYFKKFDNGKWFITNDAAKMDKQGYLFFIGRKDDIIKTSGERVSPIEIESILMKHRSVKEVAVIGIPDEIKGQIIKAFVVINKGFKENEKLKENIKMFVKKNYAGHSYPREVQFVKSLPKTNSGKIIRMKLRENNF